MLNYDHRTPTAGSLADDRERRARERDRIADTLLKAARILENEDDDLRVAIDLLRREALTWLRVEVTALVPRRDSA